MQDRKCFLLFSHQLNEVQKRELRKRYGVREFIFLPDSLQMIWSNINPDIEKLEELLKPLQLFLKEKSIKGDCVLIQGDFGATYSMVHYAKSKHLLPLYATTERKIREYINTKGEKMKESIFQHRRFREYE